MTETKQSSKRLGYREIKDILLDRMQDGTWPPGTYLPAETDLAEDFGCARTTISRALRELAADGILTRRRKAGTRVEAFPIRQAKFEMPSVRREVEEAGGSYRFHLTLREVLPAPAWLTGRIGLAPGAQVLHLHCSHYSDNQPFQFEDRWISLDAVPDAEALSHDALLSPSEWLVEAKPFSNVELTFTAARADPTQAAMMGIAEAEPVFVGERVTWFRGAPVTFARLTFAPGYRMRTVI